MQPKRIQRKRTKGWKMPENTVSVCRPGQYGNPFKVGDALCDVPFLVIKKAELTEAECEAGLITQEIAVKLHRAWLLRTYEGGCVLTEAIADLRNKNLACWCKEGEPCHADVLLEMVNK